MTNIIFSTTRQWNPGDEFILAGVRNVLDSIGASYNSIIYNRNPEILQPHSVINFAKKINGNFRGKNLLNSFLRIGMWDNSFKLGASGNAIDACIIAGSPGWYGSTSVPLYSLLRTNNVPTFFLGIGSHSPTPKALRATIEKMRIIDILSNAKLITARDSVTFEALKDFGAVQLPCPALLSVRSEKSVGSVRKIALMYSTDRTVLNHKIPSSMFTKLVSAYRAVIEKFGKLYEIEFVAHYIDEVLDYKERNLFNLPLRYSYDSADYAGIYGNFDLVIGPRVHGIGISASMGIPGVHLGHDHRSETVDGFKARTYSLDALNIDSLLQYVEETVNQVNPKSAELKAWKDEIKGRYVNAMSPAWEAGRRARE